jgi:hypothetical protein
VLESEMGVIKASLEAQLKSWKARCSRASRTAGDEGSENRRQREKSVNVNRNQQA